MRVTVRVRMITIHFTLRLTLGLRLAWCEEIKGDYVRFTCKEPPYTLSRHILPPIELWRDDVEERVISHVPKQPRKISYPS